MDETSLRAALAGLPLPKIAFFPVTGSTNTIALAWLQSGAPDGALVVADEQTAGRGRLQRRWHTPAGGALAFSLVLRPREEELAFLVRFPTLAGLAVCHALETMGAAPRIKWPNDVLINERKVCGVLAETAWTGGSPEGIVLGVGINVAASAAPANDEVMFPAGSVEAALQGQVCREKLLADVLARLFALRARISSDWFMQQWQQRLAYKNETVKVELLHEPALTGTLLGIDRQGCLLVQTADRHVQVISAGDVARVRAMV